MLIRDTKYAFNTARISNSDLDVSFLLKTRARVDWVAFCKDAANAIERSKICFFKNRVDAPHDCAIEFSSKAICSIGWHARSSLLVQPRKRFKSTLNNLNSKRCR